MIRQSSAGESPGHSRPTSVVSRSSIDTSVVCSRVTRPLSPDFSCLEIVYIYVSCLQASHPSTLPRLQLSRDRLLIRQFSAGESPGHSPPTSVVSRSSIDTSVVCRRVTRPLSPDFSCLEIVCRYVSRLQACHPATLPRLQLSRDRLLIRQFSAGESPGHSPPTSVVSRSSIDTSVVCRRVTRPLSPDFSCLEIVCRYVSRLQACHPATLPRLQLSRDRLLIRQLSAGESPGHSPPTSVVSRSSIDTSVVCRRVTRPLSPDFSCLEIVY